MTQGTLVLYNPPSLLAKHAGGQGAAQKLLGLKEADREKREMFSTVIE